jgi:hypothetical protein
MLMWEWNETSGSPGNYLVPTITGTQDAPPPDRGPAGNLVTPPSVLLLQENRPNARANAARLATVVAGLKPTEPAARGRKLLLVGSGRVAIRNQYPRSVKRESPDREIVMPGLSGPSLSPSC